MSSISVRPQMVDSLSTDIANDAKGIGQELENLDAEAAVERTRTILTWLASSNMIDLFLGNPFTYEPDPRDGDPTGTDLIRADRLWTMDGPDDRWLFYDATPWGRLMLESWWATRRETERGSSR